MSFEDRDGNDHGEVFWQRYGGICVRKREIGFRNSKHGTCIIFAECSPANSMDEDWDLRSEICRNMSDLPVANRELAKQKI